MSALNVLVQSKAVHLLTDGAIYEPADGRIIGAGPKVMPLPHLSAAIAARGLKMSLPFIADTVACEASSFDDLKSKAAELLEYTHRTMFALFSQGGGGADFEAVIAGWSEKGGTDAYLVCSHDRYGVPPWTRIEMGGGSTLSLLPNDPAISEKFFGSIRKGATAEELDPDVDGLRLLEIQRETPVSVGPLTPYSIVGAFAQLTSIDRHGVTTKILRRWPEDYPKQ